jgi:hypothetical protein
MRAQRYVGGERQELFGVLRVRFATDRTMRSSQSRRYGNDGMSLMWMPRKTTMPTGCGPRECFGDERPTGAKMMALSSGSGGGSFEGPAHVAPTSRAKRIA